MNVRKKIKQLGIENIECINKADKELLSKGVANILTSSFRNARLNKQDIEKKLIETDMYVATIPKNLPRVNYLYFNSALYFDRNINLKELNEDILHECIHKLQEYKKRKRIIQLGICNFTDTKIIGFGINEAAINYIIMNAINSKKRTIKLYGMEVPENIENYYSIVTNLIQQIVYLIGDEVLIDSTLNCNDEFIYNCIDNFGESAFVEIRDNFDKILSINNNIYKIIKENKQNNELKSYINNLTDIYINTQELILISYFKLLLVRINQLKEVEVFKEKIEGISKYVGRIKNYNFYEKFKEIQLTRLKEKEEEIKRMTSLMVITNNPIKKVYNLIRRIFIKENIKVDV